MGKTNIFAVTIVALLMLGVGYLYGAVSVQSRTTTVLGTTTETNSITLTEISTSISTATWTETSYFQSPSTGELGPWNATISYPLHTSGESCVTSEGFVYCVAGYNYTVWEMCAPVSGCGKVDLFLNRTYYAPLSPTGVGQWTRSTDYPIDTQDESCVAESNFIYCVGGMTTGPNTADVYYASLSPSGIGPWRQTSPYPYPLVPYCITDSNYVYCAGAHHNGSAYSDQPGDVYSAPLSANGVGNWTASPPMPATTDGCSASGGYAYCFGGGSCLPLPPTFDCPSPSYYAPLSSEGTGFWTNTTDLPTAGFGTSVTASGYQYFFGRNSAVYVAGLTSNGIDTWTISTAYPEGDPASCVSDGTVLYCIGGGNSSTPIPTTSVYVTEIG